MKRQAHKPASFEPVVAAAWFAASFVAAIVVVAENLLFENFTKVDTQTVKTSRYSAS